MRRNLHVRHRRQGVAAVEAVFILPFLFYLLIGVWEAGRMINVYQVITNAAREACRDAASGQRACSPYSIYVTDSTGNPLLADDPTIAMQGQITALNYIRNAGLPLSTGTWVKISNLGTIAAPPVPPAGGWNNSPPKWTYTATYAALSGNKITVTSAGSGRDPGAEAQRPDPSTGNAADLLYTRVNYADFAASRWNVVYLTPGWGGTVTMVAESTWYTARDAPVNVDTDSPGAAGWNSGNPAPLSPL